MGVFGEFFEGRRVKLVGVGELLLGVYIYVVGGMGGKYIRAVSSH